MTLTDFLLARIAEDEETARDGAGWDPTGLVRSSGRWRRDGMSSVVDDHGQLVIYGDGPAPSDAAAEHIVRHDPAHVLAECEAKRRIVERHTGKHHCPAPEDDEWATWYIAGEPVTIIRPCGDLRDLAAPFADHPDYREEWRP